MGDHPSAEPDGFEAALYGLPVPAPETDALVRDPVERAASEFLDELRRGLKPSLEVYLNRYPQQATRLREMLPLVAAMESWKIRHELEELQAARAAPPLEKLGDYRLLREIGRGGMGVVYEAVDEPTSRRVAIKLLPGRLPAASLVRRRFYGEAQLAGGLRHHHIIPVYDFGEYQGWCYYSMQLIEGLGLDRVIGLLKEPAGAIFANDIKRLFAAPASLNSSKAYGHKETEAADADSSPTRGETVSTGDDSNVDARTGRVLRRDSWWQVAKIGMQVAAALQYAHTRGILHRDIKPANLLLDAQGTVWVADFGVASNKHVMRLRGTEPAGGTLRYLAPEQLSGTFDERSDLYSLGATLYELCALQPAYHSNDRAELLRQVGHARPRRLRSVNRNVPVELEQVIVKAMAGDPARRFRSAAELLAALRPLVMQSPAAQ